MVLKLIIEREKAINLYGPVLTAIQKQMLKFWIADIKDPSDFEQLGIRMKERFWFWRIIFDIKILQQDKHVFKVRINNCEVCSWLIKFGFIELSRYICIADFKISEDHADKWAFERKNAIGNGDSFCDHTYLRL